MREFDDEVLQCFLDNQSQLFPEEDVVSNLEEAEAFLEECLAVVVNSVDEVWEFFEEEGVEIVDTFDCMKNSLEFNDHCHLNSVGRKKYSELLSTLLNKK